MMRVIPLIVVIGLVGCSQQVMTKAQWKRSISSNLSVEMVSKNIEETGWGFDCFSMPKNEMAEEYAKFIFNCAYSVADEMPATINEQQAKAYAKDVDTCATTRFSQKNMDSWNIKSAPREKQQHCLDVLEAMKQYATFAE